MFATRMFVSRGLIVFHLFIIWLLRSATEEAMAFTLFGKSKKISFNNILNNVSECFFLDKIVILAMLVIFISFIIVIISFSVVYV